MTHAPNTKKNTAEITLHEVMSRIEELGLKPDDRIAFIEISGKGRIVAVETNSGEWEIYSLTRGA